MRYLDPQKTWSLFEEHIDNVPGYLPSPRLAYTFLGMALPAGSNLGSYQNLSLVGAGGMGEVYQAQDTRLGRSVAIKVLPEEFTRDPERLARFQREARLLASLNHPNIAAIYGFEEQNGTRFLVLEFVAGRTLAEILDQGALPIDDALHICLQIADALEGAHEKGVIHRDLKPANIKITPEGKVKVLDFGLAKAMPPDASSADLSKSPTVTARSVAEGVILGTAAYMSPEQARGKSVDKRADNWAFGCVLFECLTGRKVFAGETVSDTLAAVLKLDPAWELLPEDTPANIHTLLRRCLNKNPLHRLRDIGDARIEIQDALSGHAVSAVKRTPSRRTRRELIAWLLAGVLLLALAGAFLISKISRKKEETTSMVRFEAPFPENYLFVVAAPVSLAVSPDQKRIAVVAIINGRPQIVLRSLDSGTFQPLPGTEGAAFPFWSPDSQSIGFFSNAGQLRKVAIGSGAVVNLCDAPNGRGGTWNRDGVILFAAGTVLQRVDAGGGKPVTVTKPETERETAHLWPCFLPDGSHFIYLAKGTNRENGGIYAGRLQSDQRKLLIKAESNPIYSSTGYLFCVREGNLTAQLFDADHLELSGEPVTLADRIAVHPATSQAVYGVSGDLLAYGNLSFPKSQLTWFDYKGAVISTVGPPREYRAPTLSYDGKKLAVEVLSGTASDIWILDLTRDVFSRFTFHPAADVTPVFSPDGKNIAFSSARDGNPTILMKPTSGDAGETVLYRMNSTTLINDWSKDGRYILFDNVDVRTKSDIWVLPLKVPGSATSGSYPADADRLNLEPGKPVPLVQSEFEDRKGAFSPNGRWVAYSSDESGRDEIYVRTFSRAGGKWQVSTNGGDQAAWRADGKELFYLGPDRKLMSVEVKTSGDIFEAATPRALFESRVASASALRNFYVVNPDGRKFLFYVPVNAGPSKLNVVLHWNSGLKSH